MAGDEERSSESSFFDDHTPGELDSARAFLESYSGIPPEAVDDHLREIRERLWKVGQYHCIAQLRFIRMDGIASDAYLEALKRLNEDGSTDTFLDLACCVGQVIRKLVADGVDSSRLFGVDLHPEFIDIGYDLFKDKSSLKATFVSGDIFDADDPGFAKIEGKASIINAQAFFHLFDWKQQIAIGERITRLLVPSATNAMVFGRQMGSKESGEIYNHRGGTRFVHNPESFQKLWNEVGHKTGTKWKVNSRLEPRTRPRRHEDEDAIGREISGFYFTVYRL